MWYRHITKLKTVAIVCFYVALYKIIVKLLKPEVDYRVNFIKDEMKVGEKYALIFFKTTRPITISDIEGANVFTSRNCNYCFITNNPGFAPQSEYDAIIYDNIQVSETMTYQPRNSLFILKSDDECVINKFRRCETEPVVIGYGGVKQSLCELCNMLLMKRKRMRDNNYNY